MQTPSPPPGPGLTPAVPALRTVINAGHTSTVSSLSWKGDGKLLVSGSWDGTIRIWETRGGRLLKILPEETRRVEAVAVSPDGKSVASLHAVSQAGGLTVIVVRLWDLASGAVVKSVEASKAPPPIYEHYNFLSWSPDGKALAFMTQVNKVGVLDLASGQVKLTLAGGDGRITAVSWSPDGRFIAAGGEDQVIRLYNAHTGEPAQTLAKPFPGLVQALAWSPDSAFLAAAGKDVALWQAAAGKLVRTVSEPQGRWHQVCWSPDGRFLMGNNGDIHLWEARSGARARVLKKSQFGYSEAAWSPDSRKIATCGEDIRFWDADSGRVAKIVEGYRPSTREVNWSPDGRLLLMAGFGEMFIWEVQNGKLLRRFDNLLTYVGQITWTPDKKFAAWSSGYEEMKGTWIWEAGSPTLRKFPAIGPVWSPDGQKIAAGAGGGWGIDGLKVWEAKTGRLLLTLGKAKAVIAAYSWSPDGRFLATGGDKRILRIWDAHSGRLWREMQGAGAGQGEHEDDRAQFLLWTRDGRHLISAGGEPVGYHDKNVRVWEVDSGRLVTTLTGHPGEIWAVALSPDGSLLATSSEDGQVRLWETKTFSPVHIITEQCAPSLHWSPDGRFLAAHSRSGYADCRDRDVRIWEAGAGKLRATLPGRPGEDVRSVSWSPTGRFLLAGAEDGTLTVWDVDAAKPLVYLYAFQDASVAVTPEGFFSGTGQFSRRVHFVKDLEAYDFNQFYDAFYRPDLVERRLRGEEISQDTRDLNLGEALKNPPPAVEILEPQAGATAAAREGAVKVRIQDAGGQIGDIRLYHNGKLIYSDGVYRLARGDAGGPPPVVQATLDAPYATRTRGAELRQVTLGPPGGRAEPFHPRQGTVTKDYRVTLMQGENVFSACAFNGSNLVSSELVSVTVPAAIPKRPPQLHVLTVGLNDAAQPALPVLTYAKKDAQDLASLLEKKAAPLYGRVQVRFLGDAGATKTAVLQAALDLAAGMGPEDVFVLAVAAHGITRDDLYYLFTRQEGDGRPGGQALSSPEIMELFKAVPALKQVLILDTCQAGGLNRTVAGLYDARVSVLAKALGMHVLAGASSQQEALDDYQGQGNGLFTHFLLKGLQGAADADLDRRVTVKEAGAYLEKAVKEASQGRQVPQIRTFGEDLPLSQVTPRQP